MKLHLPKVLCVAVLAMFAGSAMGANIDFASIKNDSEGNTLWDVGVPEHTLDPVSVTNPTSVPSTQVNYNATENGITVDGYTDKVMLLDGNDKLGTFDSNGNLRTQYSNTWTYYTAKREIDNNNDGKSDSYGTSFAEYSGIAQDKVISNTLNVTGTMLIKDAAQVILGGQYKQMTRIYKLDGTSSDSSGRDDYMGLVADTVVVQGSSDGFTNLKTERATIDNLVIHSGKVELHPTFHQGSSYLSTSNFDNKLAYITTSLYQDGGALVVGKASASAHDSVKNSTRNKLYYTSGFGGSIIQSDGKMHVYGNSQVQASIKQSGGEMYFRDLVSINSKFNITQENGGKLQLGMLYSTSKLTTNITQTGSGSIMLAYGADLKSGSTLNIVQEGNGIISIGGTPDNVEKSTWIDNFAPTPSNTTYT